jgi:eukaryotic-like serine/threonine-protein kinase
MALKIPTPGVLIENKYRLAERIGGGGMGDVFRAENVIAGRAVAIKFLHPELAEDAELCQRFFQEAQAVNRIRHPNIVDVIDAGTSESGPYLVMEHLDGESVGTSLARVIRFEIDAALGTMVPVLEALEAAHRVGVVHRDLKPENIFIAVDAARGVAVVRLLDFGIAKVLAGPGPSPRTRTGIVFGTPDYLSPEQATGEGPLDGRSDLFAVGVLLYELLTGTRPFRAPTAVATAFRVVHAPAPSLAAAGIHVGADVEALVARLLQKESARRYQTAGEVTREIERISPDAGKRAAAVGRVIQVTKRLGRTPAPTPTTKEKEWAPRTATPPDSARSLGVATTGRASPLPLSVRETPPARPSSPEGRSSSPDGRGWNADPRASSPDPRGSNPEGRGSNPEGRASIPDARGSNPETRSAGPVRPLPARFAGHYQVRGPVIRAVDRAVAHIYGRAARDRIVAQMPARYAADLRNDSINALVAYDLEAIDAYLEIATAALVGHADGWRELGRSALSGELEAPLRGVTRPCDLPTAVRRGLPVWSRLLCFGVWRTVDRPSGGKLLVQVGEIEPASLPLRFWLVGVVEETVRRAIKGEPRLTITLGETGFSPDLAFEMG